MREAILRHDLEVNGYGLRRRGERWVLTRSATEMLSHLWLKWQPFERNEFRPGVNVLSQPEPGGECRVLVYNGVGTGYGDLICGSVWVRALHRLIEASGYIPKIRLVPVPSDHLEGRYRDIFTRDPHVWNVTFGGVPIQEFGAAHLAISMEALVADSAFDNVDMIEYFFHRGGLRGCQEDRIPKLYPDQEEFAKGKAWVASLPGKKRVLVNFFGSGMRRVPCGMWQRLLNPLVKRKFTVLVSTPPAGESSVQSFITALFADKDVFCTAKASTSWSAHVGIISGCRGVLCTDTSTTHAAAALGVPSVTMFQFIDPDLRIKHYPKAIGWAPEVFRKGPHWGRSHPYPGWEESKHDEDPVIVKPWEECDLSEPACLLRKAVA